MTEPIAAEAVIVNAEPPPAYEPAANPTLGDRVQQMQMELDLPEDIVQDLLTLAGSDIIVIADDSSSMNSVAEPGSGSVATRWDELRNT